jgi:quinol-cytochrome oxidoreductase complex cytochrome b subunit
VPEPPRDALEPEVATPARGLMGRVQRSEVWRSMFRHPQLDTPRGRALQSFSNFFLHVYPVKIPSRVLRLRYSFRLGFIAAVLFGILVVTGVYLMFFYTPSPAAAYGDMQHLKTGVGFGQLMRNVHRWSAHLMVLVIVLHLVRVFYAGA